MRKLSLLLVIAASALISCSKTDVGPSASTSDLTTSARAKPVAPPAAPAPAPGGGGAAGGGGGNGGGGAAAPASNLDVYTKQLTAGWLAALTTNESVPNIPGAFGTITLIITLKSNGTFTLASTDNVSGAQVSNSGTWQFTIPPNLPIDENGILVLTSGGTTLMSGYVLFVRTGVLSYQTTINNVDKTINSINYVFQKN